uniref:Uncharacterized protein n=1 Tax=Arundo donax TaxID=35708 RepID=A0A0A9ERP1_ARUDO
MQTRPFSTYSNCSSDVKSTDSPLLAATITNHGHTATTETTCRFLPSSKGRKTYMSANSL